MSWNNHLTRLNKLLADLYPEKDETYRIVEMAGIPRAHVAFKDSAMNNWYNILKEANKRGKVDEVVEIAIMENEGQKDLLELRNIFQEVNQVAPKQKASVGYENKLKKILAEGDIASVLKPLTDITKAVSTDLYNSTIMLSGRYKGIVRERQQGVIGDETYRLNINRINSAILHLIDEIPQEKKHQAFLEEMNREAGISSGNADIVIPSSSEFERVIGDRDDTFEIDWIQKALKASIAVCKVDCSAYLDNLIGTGFLLKGGYLLTNNHVILNEECAEKAKIIFNYRVGTAEPQVEYTLDLSVFETSDPHELDYTLVKVKENGIKPLSDWGFLTLDTLAVPKINDKVNIIQHPEGLTMKIALPDEVISVWNQHVFYVADTKGGSSGSPVFNQEWKVVALHHAGKNEEEGGLQINAAGEKKPTNRGVLIKDIIADWKSKGIEI